MNGLTNATSQDTAWCPKHQIVKSVLSVRRHYPKRDRFPENLSIYLSSPAPNSPLQNPSNFGATASHWLLYILLFFFFLILNRWMRGALCVATRLYILYLVADESISGWEFLLLIPKSPHSHSDKRSYEKLARSKIIEIMIIDRQRKAWENRMLYSSENM